MKQISLLRWAACTAVSFFALSAPVLATVPLGYVQVSGSALQDSTGTLVANATISFAPVNNSGVAISYQVNGHGQAMSSPVTALVTNGAFTVQLADTYLTSPQNVSFAVTVTDNVSGASILGPGYSQVQPTGQSLPLLGVPSWCTAATGSAGGSCNFDAYPPNLAALALIQTGPAGPQGPAGVPGTGGLAPGWTATGSGSSQVVTAPGTFAAGAIASQTSQVLFGNSISHGEGVYLPQQAIPALLQRMHGGGLKSYAFEANQIGDDASLAYTNVVKSISQQTLAEPLYVIAEGTNDAQICGTSVGCEANFANEYLATAAYLLLPRASMVYGQDTSCVPTGVWYADNVLQIGMGKASFTAANVLTCSITTTGNPIVETWAANPGNASMATISIDGGAATTLLGYGASGQTVQTSNLVSEVPTARLFSVSAGTHTAVITVTSTSTPLTTSAWTTYKPNIPGFTVSNPGYTMGQQVVLTGCTTNTTWNNLPATIASYPTPTTSLFGVVLPGITTVTGSGTDTCVLNTNPFTQLWMGSAGTVVNTLLAGGVWYQNNNNSAAATAAYDGLVSSLVTTLQASGFPSPYTTFIPVRTYVNYTTDMASGIALCSGIGSGGEHPNCQGAAHTAQAFQQTRPDLFNAYVGPSGDTTIPPRLNQSSNNVSGTGGFTSFSTTGPFQSTAWNGGITWGWSVPSTGYLSGATTTAPLQPYAGIVSANVFFMPSAWEFCFSPISLGSDLTNSSNQSAITSCPIWGMTGNGQFHAQHLYADTDLYLAGALFAPVSANSPLTITTTTTPQIKAAYDGSHSFAMQVNSSGIGSLVPTGNGINLYVNSSKLMLQMDSGGFYEFATGTAVSGTNYASPSFFTTASAYISGAAVNVQLGDYIAFNSMTSSPTYSTHQLVNENTTLPMVTSMVGTGGHYLDLNPQASTSYVLNHASDMFYATDKYAPAWYANSVLSFGLGYTGTTAATSCGSLSGAAGCLTVPIAGVTHYVPFF